MTYSKYFFPQDKKIPTPITIGVILILILLLTRLFTTSPIPSKASKSKLKSQTVVNLTSNQAGVLWETEEKESGWIIYGKTENSLTYSASDERDLQDKKNPYFNHLVTLKNLQPDTRYYYKIISNNRLIGDQAFSFKTPTSQSNVSDLNPAYGKVIRENGEALEGAVVKLTFANAYPLVTLSKTTGEWLIPLNNESAKAEDKIIIEIFSEDRKKSSINSILSTLSPVPQTIIIGQDYNFLNANDVLSASSKNIGSANNVEIIYPKDQSIIPAGRPLIKGTAVAGKQVFVTLESTKKYSFSVITDKKGIWNVVVKDSLPAGSYLLKVNTEGFGGSGVTLTRKFSIAKSGEQVLAASTPEATLSPTEVPTEIPTIYITPTVVFYTPYLTASPTLYISPPTSGVDMTSWGYASVGLIILGAGFLLIF